MDAITVIFVLFLFLFAIFFTLIVRRDWLIREERERYRRRRLYAAHGGVRLGHTAHGGRPAHAAARHTPGSVEPQHFGPKDAAHDAPPGEKLTTVAEGQGDKLKT